MPMVDRFAVLNHHTPASEPSHTGIVHYVTRQSTPHLTPLTATPSQHATALDPVGSTHSTGASTADSRPTDHTTGRVCSKSKPSRARENKSRSTLSRLSHVETAPWLRSTVIFGHQTHRKQGNQCRDNPESGDLIVCRVGRLVFNCRFVVGIRLSE